VRHLRFWLQTSELLLQEYGQEAVDRSLLTTVQLSDVPAL